MSVLLPSAGLASIAGALAAELLATLLQHPLGVNAPTTLPTTAGSKGPGTGQAEAPALGAVPHMVGVCHWRQPDVDGNPLLDCLLLSSQHVYHLSSTISCACRSVAS
jgi:hypothetical protein